MLCTSGIVDDVMLSYNAGGNRQKSDARRAYVSSSSPGGDTRPQYRQRAIVNTAL